ncbi:MAG TPA: T9SS type A sorting domain-containing protein [Flavobacteriaceae bacterium]|nr:T9SS type A sorting domain-containing protein [Flavobacteriaceae bacterium]
MSTNNYSLEKIKIFPNPVSSNYVNIATTQDLDVILYNVLGKQILTEKVTSSQNTIDLSNFNKGIYLVKLISENGQVIKKLIKQ